MYDLTTIANGHAGASAQPQQRPASLTAIIARIEDAIESETRAIRTDVGFDIKASNARKSRHLYELNRALRGVSADSLRPEHRTGLTRLREKLADNEQAIRAHLNAVGEVAELLQDAIRRSEADGTYSEHQFARGSA